MPPAGRELEVQVLGAAQSASPAVRRSALDRLFTGGCVLGDGAMATMLLDRGASIDTCCEELNLRQPEAIAAVHAAYLQAGAEIIETNTFGANAYRLERCGLRSKVREINLAAVRIARHCVIRAAGAQIAGAIGPLGMRIQPHGEVSCIAARSAFADQVHALAEGGPGVGADLLILETMMSVAEATEAIAAARDAAPWLRLVVMMTVDENGDCLDGSSAQRAAARLTDLGADAIGCNCSYGPTSVLRAIERMRAATPLPLAAMPNAGMPFSVEGRSNYPISPVEMAAFARSCLQAGVTLIGGCCGTTPDHIRAIKSVLQESAPQESG
jgi:homocysteine S-methyltransferase